MIYIHRICFGTVFASLSFFAVVPLHTAFASALFFKVTHSTNVYYKAVVLLDTKGQTINAVSSSLILPPAFHLEKISTGNSPFGIWITKPALVETGNVSFAGLIPGGITTTAQELFSFTFTIDEGQTGKLDFGDTSILLNDGYGTPSSVTLLESTVSIETIPKAVESDLPDTELPEMFTPILSRSELAFDNQYFISFQTQDKDSGVVSYRLKEGIFTWYTDVESPYVLKHQTLNRDITIEARDGVGNVRTVVLESEHPLAWYFYPESIALFSCVLFLLGLGSVIFLSKRKKSTLL